MSDLDDPVEPPAAPRLDYRAALSFVRAEAEALADAELKHVCLEVPQVVPAVVGRIPGILALRGAAVRELPLFPIRWMDGLENYALALGMAHAESAAASAPPAELEAVERDAVALRRQLVTDVRALVARGYIAAEVLEKLRSTRSKEARVFDLLALAQAVRSQWRAVAGKTSITLEELELADSLALRLTQLGSQAAATPAAVAAALRLRQQVFTLFVRAYGQVRRAVLYLRHDEGDADEIAPSLWAGRARRPRVAKASEAPDGPPTKF